MAGDLASANAAGVVPRLVHIAGAFADCRAVAVHNLMLDQSVDNRVVAVAEHSLAVRNLGDIAVAAEDNRVGLVDRLGADKRAALLPGAAA